MPGRDLASDQARFDVPRWLSFSLGINSATVRLRFFEELTESQLAAVYETDTARDPVRVRASREATDPESWVLIARHRSPRGGRGWPIARAVTGSLVTVEFGLPEQDKPGVSPDTGDFASGDVQDLRLGRIENVGTWLEDLLRLDVGSLVLEGEPADSGSLVSCVYRLSSVAGKAVVVTAAARPARGWSITAQLVDAESGAVSLMPKPLLDSEPLAEAGPGRRVISDSLLQPPPKLTDVPAWLAQALSIHPRQLVLRRLNLAPRSANAEYTTVSRPGVTLEVNVKAPPRGKARWRADAATLVAGDSAARGGAPVRLTTATCGSPDTMDFSPPGQTAAEPLPEIRGEGAPPLAGRVWAWAAAAAGLSEDLLFLRSLDDSKSTEVRSFYVVPMQGASQVKVIGKAPNGTESVWTFSAYALPPGGTQGLLLDRATVADPMPLAFDPRERGGTDRLQDDAQVTQGDAEPPWVDSVSADLAAEKRLAAFSEQVHRLSADQIGALDRAFNGFGLPYDRARNAAEGSRAKVYGEARSLGSHLPQGAKLAVKNAGAALVVLDLISTSDFEFLYGPWHHVVEGGLPPRPWRDERLDHLPDLEYGPWQSPERPHDNAALRDIPWAVETWSALEQDLRSLEPKVAFSPEAAADDDRFEDVDRWDGSTPDKWLAAALTAMWAESSVLGRMQGMCALLDHVVYWRLLAADDVAKMAAAVAQAPDQRMTGASFSDWRSRGVLFHPEKRSATLARLGRWYYFSGDWQNALTLWSQAHLGFEVDRVIADMVESIAYGERHRRPIARALVMLINLPSLRQDAYDYYFDGIWPPGSHR